MVEYRFLHSTFVINNGLWRPFLGLHFIGWGRGGGRHVTEDTLPQPGCAILTAMGDATAETLPPAPQ